MKKIEVKLKKNSYPIIIKRGLKNNILDYLKDDLGNFGIVITSPTVYKIYRPLIESNFKKEKFKIIVTADGEKTKSKAWAFKIINQILKLNQKNKKLFIVCLGGGTIGDLGGFVSSIYKRGIPYVQIPTTLLGQVDSSIGGKTAINLPQAKNIVGTFYQPKAVLIDPTFLNTLAKKELKEGLAEAIKYGLIKDKKLFYFLKNNHKKIITLEPSSIDKVIHACAKIKAIVVAEDEQEKKGIRTILNFGHTFAHGLEAASRYQKISHGKAVGLGILYASYLSEHLKKTSPAVTQEIEKTLKSFDLPVKNKFNSQEVLGAITHDKKFVSGKIRMVLIEEVGRVIVSTEINQDDLKKTLKKIKSID